MIFLYMFKKVSSYFTWHPLYKWGFRDGSSSMRAAVYRGEERELSIEQAEETTVHLGPKEEEHLRILISYPEYATLRKYLLQLSLEYFERSSNAPEKDCYVISRMGNFLRQLVLHLDQRKNIAKGDFPDSFTP
jgi:hypothetical protein